MSESKKPSRGWQGTVMKLMRAEDFVFTVTGSEYVTDDYLRVSFTSGGYLAATSLHPTMWVRAWFTFDGAQHQRGYTIVNPDPAADTLDIEFALHDGPAANWARTAAPGDELPVTRLGSKFALPDTPPTGWLIIGDPASLPAINSLLDAITASGAPSPATIWFECSHDSDRDLPIASRPGDTITFVPRERDGKALVETISANAFDATGHRAWVALDDVSTRAITAILRNDYKLGRAGVTSQGYWKVGQSFS